MLTAESVLRNWMIAGLISAVWRLSRYRGFRAGNLTYVTAAISKIEKHRLVRAPLAGWCC
jgi:hypothetical protein